MIGILASACARLVEARLAEVVLSAIISSFDSS